MLMDEKTILSSTYDNLPLTSTHWGTYRVEAVDGKVTALHPFGADSDPSPIGTGIVDVLDSPARIKMPMVRKSWLEHGPGTATDKRGQEPFVQVSWDEAETLVASELSRVKTDFGNKAIFGGSYGWASAGRFHHAQSQLHRFLNCIGGYTRSVNTYSYAAAEVILPHVLGNFGGMMYGQTSLESVANSTELFVSFGGFPARNCQIASGGTGDHSQVGLMQKARQRGAEFISVSPIRSDMLERVDAEWLAARPGSDTAILLALAHCLLAENLHDTDFLARYSSGFDAFAAYVTGQSDGVPKSAEWAASLSDIPAATIRTLARRMASSRTMLSVSWSLTRQDHGEQPYWAAITLATMLGQIGLPGGGVGFGYGATNSVGMQRQMLNFAALPQGKNAVDDFIPVARISDMLLNPETDFVYDGGRYTYPDIRLVYWAGGNPFHHHQDLQRLVSAWQKPETVIVHEWCWNTLAKHADIILPCTTHLERPDIMLNPRDPFIVMMEQVVPPVGEARNDYDIFANIARHMKVEDSFTEGRDMHAWQEWMYETSRDMAAEKGVALPDLDSLKQKGWVKIDVPDKPHIMIEDFIDDPVVNPLNTASGKIEIVSQTIANFDDDMNCSPHAIWREPSEWLGNADDKFSLHLISNQPQTKLHSQLDHGSHSRAGKINQREPVTMHPDDAAARGLHDGDLVQVFNDRGICLGVLVVSDDVRPDVVQMATGAWLDPMMTADGKLLCKHGNPNVLTHDLGTSKMTQGPAALSCLVEVTKYNDAPPSMTAFDPPEIITR
jgi:biotin/methionine sulfoxide reductase